MVPHCNRHGPVLRVILYISFLILTSFALPIEFSSSPTTSSVKTPLFAHVNTRGLPENDALSDLTSESTPGLPNADDIITRLRKEAKRRKRADNKDKHRQAKLPNLPMPSSSIDESNFDDKYHQTDNDLCHALHGLSGNDWKTITQCLPSQCIPIANGCRQDVQPTRSPSSKQSNTTTQTNTTTLTSTEHHNTKKSDSTSHHHSKSSLVHVKKRVSLIQNCVLYALECIRANKDGEEFLGYVSITHGEQIVHTTAQTNIANRVGPGTCVYILPIDGTKRNTSTITKQSHENVLGQNLDNSTKTKQVSTAGGGNSHNLPSFSRTDVKNRHIVVISDNVSMVIAQPYLGPTMTSAPLFRCQRFIDDPTGRFHQTEGNDLCEHVAFYTVIHNSSVLYLNKESEQYSSESEQHSNGSEEHFSGSEQHFSGSEQHSSGNHDLNESSQQKSNKNGPHLFVGDVLQFDLGQSETFAIVAMSSSRNDEEIQQGRSEHISSAMQNDGMTVTTGFGKKTMIHAPDRIRLDRVWPYANRKQVDACRIIPKAQGILTLHSNVICDIVQGDHKATCEEESSSGNGKSEIQGMQKNTIVKIGHETLRLSRTPIRINTPLNTAVGGGVNSSGVTSNKSSNANFRKLKFILHFMKAAVRPSGTSLPLSIFSERPLIGQVWLTKGSAVSTPLVFGMADLLRIGDVVRVAMADNHNRKDDKNNRSTIITKKTSTNDPVPEETAEPNDNNANVGTDNENGVFRVSGPFSAVQIGLGRKWRGKSGTYNLYFSDPKLDGISMVENDKDTTTTTRSTDDGTQQQEARKQSKDEEESCTSLSGIFLLSRNSDLVHAPSSIDLDMDLQVGDQISFGGSSGLLDITNSDHYEIRSIEKKGRNSFRLNKKWTGPTGGQRACLLEATKSQQLLENLRQLMLGCQSLACFADIENLIRAVSIKSRDGRRNKGQGGDQATVKKAQELLTPLVQRMEKASMVISDSAKQQSNKVDSKKNSDTTNRNHEKKKERNSKDEIFSDISVASLLAVPDALKEAESKERGQHGGTSFMKNAFLSDGKNPDSLDKTNDHLSDIESLNAMQALARVTRSTEVSGEDAHTDTFSPDVDSAKAYQGQKIAPDFKTWAVQEQKKRKLLDTVQAYAEE
eukprot:g536.t1